MVNEKDYTLQELIDLIGEDSEKSPNLHQDNKLQDFYDKLNIRAGVDRIPNYIIYYTYKVGYKGELSKIEFFRQFKKDFIQVRTGKQRSYMLDGESFNLTEEGKIEAKFYDKEN